MPLLAGFLIEVCAETCRASIAAIKEPAKSAVASLDNPTEPSMQRLATAVTGIMFFSRIVISALMNEPYPPLGELSAYCSSTMHILGYCNFNCASWITTLLRNGIKALFSNSWNDACLARSRTAINALSLLKYTASSTMSAFLSL